MNINDKNSEPIKSLSDFVNQYRKNLGIIFKDPSKSLYYRGESMDYGDYRLTPKVYRKNIIPKSSI